MWLKPYRILDLADEKGSFCSKILGDLGADVIKIEPPQGSSERRCGPFYEDMPDAEKSLFWFAFNVNKRGITLDIESRDGQAIFRRLVGTADFVIESFEPGYMDSLGLGYRELSRINQRVVVTSITPFGSTGPHSKLKASDISVNAWGGYMFVCGDPDRAPLRISYPIAFRYGSLVAAGGTMIAHYHREITGQGQHVDVSVQQSVTELLMSATQAWDLTKFIHFREGGAFTSPGAVTRRIIHRCKDGWVSMLMRGVPSGIASTRSLVHWMEDEGMASDFMKRRNWDVFDPATTSSEEMALINQEIQNFFLTKSKDEIYEQAIKRRIILFPVATVKDISSSVQLASRQFWLDVEHPELGKCLTYPGPFSKSASQAGEEFCRAPLLGEHNVDIYQQEMGFSREEMVMLKEAGVI